MTSYAKAGVDIDAANRAKQMMAAAVTSTHTKRCWPGWARSVVHSTWSDPVRTSSAGAGRINR